MKSKILKIICSVVLSSVSIIADSQDISLPAPDKTGGKPLMQVLNERQTIRTFTKDTLTRQQISDLLWAAWGINRADQKKHTAPTAFIAQNVYLYCTSANLGSVVRGLVPRDQLSAEMGLRSNQRIILAHTVGVPQGSK